MLLLQQIANFENLEKAFHKCAIGKKRDREFQKMRVQLGDELKQISEQLLRSEYEWGEYREFIVKDPKARLVMAAPFRDRVVHHAIHQIIEPPVDSHFHENIFACRCGKGNLAAVKKLHECLLAFGPDRYVLKLDVRKYFASIEHNKLFELLFFHLEAEFAESASIRNLILSLLKSYPGYRDKGIPIGNLTSQLFANLYLHPLDSLICERLGGEGAYLRYMDDLVIIAPTKVTAIAIMREAVEFARQELYLEMPRQKTVLLGTSAVPFLGFLTSESGVSPLGRNLRRFDKKRRRLLRILNELQSYDRFDPAFVCSRLQQVEQSFNSWCEMGLSIRT